MVNSNITSATKVLDTRLWSGVSDADTSWQTGTATGTISMAIVDLVVTDGTSGVTQYDLALATNPVTGSELIGVLSIHNATTAAGVTLTALEHTSTLIKFTTDSDGVNGDTMRVTFLYR